MRRMRIQARIITKNVVIYTSRGFGNPNLPERKIV